MNDLLKELPPHVRVAVEFAAATPKPDVNTFANVALIALAAGHYMGTCEQWDAHEHARRAEKIQAMQMLLLEAARPADVLPGRCEEVSRG